MALVIQNFRSEVTGEVPDSLKPAQIAFNIADSFLFLGDGSDERKDVDGNPILPNPPAGQGYRTYELGGGGSVENLFGSSPINVTIVDDQATISIVSATTTALGAVQLNDTTSSTSVTEALTAFQGKVLQDQISALAVSSNITFAGTVTGVNGEILTTTVAGATAGFVVGDLLPAPSASNEEFFAIITVGGTMTPPGGVATSVNPGDWWLSTGAEWQLIDIGQPPTPSPTPAAPVVEGIVYGLTNTGDYSTALGYNALSSITTGAANVGIGVNAGSSITIGDSNVAIGGGALITVSSGTLNTALGAQAGFGVTTGCYNLFLGHYSGSCLTTGLQNAFLGGRSGENLITGDNNIFIGDSAGFLSTSGNCNVIIGSCVQAASPTDSYQLAIGYANGCNWLTGVGSGAIRPAAGIIDSTGSCGAGGQVLTSTGSNGVTWGTALSVAGTSPINVSTVGSVSTVSITAASTTVSGAVQLNNTLTSTSTAQALTAAQGKALADQIAALPANPAVSGTAPITVTGTALAPVVGISASSTSAAGAVQLNNTLSSTSITQALTAAQGKVLQDTLNALSVSANLTFAGTFDAATSQMLTVSNAGTLQSFIVGADIPSPAAGNLDYFVIITTGGIYDPPGAGGPYTLTQGDWLLSDGTVWQFVNVGPDLPQASTSAVGVVELATSAETITGTSGDLAVTPSGANAAYIGKAQITAKGDLITGTASNTPTALGVGTNGQVLTANSACASGLTWTAPSAGGSGTVTSIIAGAGLSGGTITTTGTITLNTACVIAPTAFTAKGALLVGTGASASTALTVGTNGQVLYANSACATGVCWGVIPAAVPCSAYTAKGSILAATAASTPTNVTVGSDGQALIACAACTSGVTWGSVGVSVATPTVSGTVLGLSNATSSNTSLGNSALLNVQPASNSNVAIGCFASACATTAILTTAVGTRALVANLTGNYNTAVGACALCQATGATNTALGALAGKNITTGQLNVVIGANVDIPDPTGGRQLAIGQDCNQYWLTGCPDQSIKPGAGVRDCQNTTGTVGQVLKSTGANGIVWSSGTTPAATPICTGTVIGCTTASNSALGCNALLSATTGSVNVAIGSNALSALTTGCQNVAIGFNAGVFDTTGINNVAIGFCAGAADGNSNTVFIGANAGTFSNASVNIGIGSSALAVLTSGTNNVALGNSSLVLASTASGNTAIGHCSLGNTSGSNNVAVGLCAGNGLGAGSNNVLIGSCVVAPVATGNCQLAIGPNSTTYWITGCSDLSIKPGAGIRDCAGCTGTAGQVLMSTGANKLCWGAGAVAATPIAAGVVFGCIFTTNTSLGCNVGVGLNNNVYIGLNAATGAGAGVATSNNVAIGSSAGRCLTTGSSNTIMGCGAGFALTTAVCNITIGTRAGCNLTSGSNNIAIGVDVVLPSATGNCQLAIGTGVNSWLTGDCTFAIKPGAGIRDCAGATGTAGQVLMSNGANAVCWGPGSGGSVATPIAVGTVYGCTNCSTAALGQNAGKALNSATTGTVAIGQNALCSATSGTFNTAVGVNALGATTTGGNNVAIGVNALGGIINSNQNTAIGYNAGCDLVTGCNNVVIGQGAQLVSPNGSDQLAIGASGYNWLTGTINGDIKPGRGFIDCTGSSGTSGQILASTGSYLQWASISGNTGIVGWTSAGTIQTVGIAATAVAPTISGDTTNNVRYRQLGLKEWELIMTLSKNAGGTAGSGDYLFTLPNGLSFDTTLPWQAPVTALVGQSSGDWNRYILPGMQSGLTDGNSFTRWAMPVVWSGTQYRIIASLADSGATQAFGSNFFTINQSVGVRFRMQFTVA